MSEEEPDLWSVLPFDVHQRVFDFMSPAECDRLSLVSTHFLTAARSSECWRKSYLFQLYHSLAVPKLLLPGDYRQAALGRLRPRYDGVYFAKCSYVRIIGAGQSLTDTRTFLSIVYYRFFRFFSDGSAAMITHPADMSSGTAKAPIPIYERLVAATSPHALIEQSTRLEKASIVCFFTFDQSNITFRYEDDRNQWIGRMTVHHWKYRPSAIIRWERYSYWNMSDYSRYVTDMQARGIDLQNIPDQLLVEEDIPKELLCSIGLRIEEHFPDMKFKAEKRLQQLF